MKKFLSVFCIVLISLCCVSCNKSTVNLFDFTFKFDDETYTLSESITAFTDNGWKLPDKFSLDTNIKQGNLRTTYFVKGENTFSVELFNNTSGDIALKDCKVGRVTYDFSGDIKVSTAGNFCLNGKTIDEVIKKYGEPYSSADYSLYTEVIYDKDPETSIYDRFTFRFDKETKVINYIDITYFN